jgi:hypothetical protein
MPEDKRFKTKELSSQIHIARLSFADPDEMLCYLDIERTSSIARKWCISSESKSLKR